MPPTEKPRFKNWFDMFKPLAFMYGVPIGIVAGTITATLVTLLDIWDGSDPAAKGLVVGFGSAFVVGGGWAAVDAGTRFRWVRTQVTVKVDWDKLVQALNLVTASEHYLLLRCEEGYLVYCPSLATPVALGPLTVSGEYLSVVVARLSESEIKLIGPKRIVNSLVTAAESL
jgi:hypothetical protein